VVSVTAAAATARHEKNSTAALIRITAAAANQIGFRMNSYPTNALANRAIKTMLLMGRLQPHGSSAAAV
jgi:hypothetical protein